MWKEEEAKEFLIKLLSGLQILLLDEEISEKAGAIRAKYGTSITDALIAATAIAHNLKLATLNIKDFENIEGIELFKS